MSDSGPLRGSCSCGRNHYTIILPSSTNTILNTFQVLYDEGADYTRPLTLRLPLASIQSTTHSLYPDETHSSIRRSFTSTSRPYTRRNFCGYCGTPLSYWSEENEEEAEFLRVDLGSLRRESLDLLNEIGLIEEEVDDNEEEEIGKTSGQGDASTDTRVAAKRRRTEGEEEKRVVEREVRGNTWFEEMVEGSRLGKIRRRRGGRTSKDGGTTYEWEVVEVGGDVAEGGSSAGIGEKRKLGDLGEEVVGDTEMKG